MAKEALHAGNKHTNDGRSGEQGVIAASILLAAASAKAQHTHCNPVCKADLISLANKEEIRTSVALIDRLLSPYRFANV